MQLLIPSAQLAGAIRIHRLHHCRGVKTPPSSECLGYEIKPSDCEAQVLELWGMWSTPLLPLLPGLLWPRVVASDRVLYMGQIEQFDI